MTSTAPKTPAKHACTQWMCLRGLALIYLIAFLSLFVQLDGLIGSAGISPARLFLHDVSAALPDPLAAYMSYPSLAWIGSSDTALNVICGLGIVAAACATLDIAAGMALVVAWVCYLSFVNIGQDFLAFQWDSLLLEAGFLAIFWSPWRWVGPLWRRQPLAQPEGRLFRVGLFLFRWLLFRLMFLSGIVKLASHDVSWWHLSALRYHYETQPLPTPVAWYAHLLPDWFNSFSVAAVFFIELIVPFLMFGPRRIRYAACVFTVLLQFAILITGNYTFFNYLTIVLCLTLLDDFVVARLLPQRIKRFVIGGGTEEAAPSTSSPVRARTQLIAVASLAVLVGLLSAQELSEQLTELSLESRGVNLIPSFRIAFLSVLRPLHIVNSYGLFAVMTTSRPEISVEGSTDGKEWKPYVFKYKPGPLDRAPPVVAPFQPRLDWQMWFASLGTVEQNPWFEAFVVRLLQGSKPVLDLLAYNPFPLEPPKYIRATIRPYHFTTFSQKKETGDWWQRGAAEIYMPPVSLGSR